MDPIFTSQAEAKHLLSPLLAVRLDITWKDRITNTAVKCPLCSLLRQCRLHWLRHKQWINDESKRTSYTQSYYLSKGQLAILFFAMRMLANRTSGFSKLVKPPVKMPSSVAAGTSDWVAEIKDDLAHSGYILFGPQ